MLMTAQKGKRKRRRQTAVRASGHKDERQNKSQAGKQIQIYKNAERKQTLQISCAKQIE